jgi:general secretion pathway protein C
MELLFRKYFWTLNLAFLALAGFLAARTANTFLASKLEPGLDVDAMVPAHAEAAPRTTGPTALPLEATAAVFGVTLPPPPEAIAQPTAPVYDPNAPPVKSSLRLTLVGTMVAFRPEYSFAAIRDENKPETGLFMVGDSILTAQVKEIERKRVILMNDGRKEYIAMGEDPAAGSSIATISTAPSSMDTSPDASGDGGDTGEVACTGDNCTITRDVVQSQLSNMSALATQARIVPSFKDGVANGFKLFSIRPGSIYSKIGIQNGDVIRKINGYEINSPDKALEVYSRLKESSRIEIELERRGQAVKKAYSITN